MMGTAVQWVDPKDGGWKTGEIVRIYGRTIQESGIAYAYRTHLLVRHSCTGQLEFVNEGILQIRPQRKDYEPAT